MARGTGIDVDIKFDRIREINNRIPNVVATLIRKAVAETEGLAKLRVPVDTGALKNSIASRVEIRGDSVVGEVGTNLHYAPYIEFGTRFSAAQPFLVPAFDRVRMNLATTLGRLEGYLH